MQLGFWNATEHNMDCSLFHGSSSVNSLEGTGAKNFLKNELALAFSLAIVG